MSIFMTQSSGKIDRHNLLIILNNYLPRKVHQILKSGVPF